jgi:tetratricopeptide (TPR) repeat protein
MRSMALAGSLALILPFWAISSWGQTELPKNGERAELQRSAQSLIEQAYREGERGQNQEAEGHYTQALELYRRLFPKDEYPRGDPSIAMCLYDLGNAVIDQGKFAQAESNYRLSLEMWRQLHPEKEEPNGHPEIGITLHNLGVALMRQGKLDQAADCHRQALAMRRRLYPKDRFPLGHIQIAKSLIELGQTHNLLGNTVIANGCRQRAVDMLSRLKSGKSAPVGDRSAPKISLGGEDFFLTSSFQVPAAFAAADEYLPVGQDFESYSQLITVTIYRQPLDLPEFASYLGTPSAKLDPALQSRVTVRPDGTGAFVDYVFSARDPEPHLEYNMFRLIKLKDSLISYQYVRRLYNTSAEQEREFRKRMDGDRSKWQKALDAADFPVPKGRPD